MLLLWLKYVGCVGDCCFYMLLYPFSTHPHLPFGKLTYLLEIVDGPIKNGDVLKATLVYQK